MHPSSGTKVLAGPRDTPKLTRCGCCPQGAGDPAQSNQMQIALRIKENEVEDCDSAIQSMLWRRLHCLALLSVGVQSIGPLPCGWVMQFTSGSGPKWKRL